MVKKNLNTKGGEKEMALNPLLDRNLVAQRYGKSEGTINQWVSKKKYPIQK